VKKNKNYIITIFILFSNLAFGQDYFNKVIPFSFGNPNVIEMVGFGNSFLISTIYTKDANVQSTIVQIDDQNAINYHHYQDIALGPKSLNVINNEVYLYAKDRNISLDLQLIKLTLDWKRDFTVSMQSSGERNILGPSTKMDNNLYNGFIYVEDDIKKFGINKTSSDGQLKWTKNFESNIGYSYLWTILSSQDKNLFASYTLKYQDEFKGHGYLMKIDTLGEIIWKTLPLERIDGGAAAIKIVELSNRNIAVTYRKDMWDVYEYWCCLHPRPPALILMDSTGNIIKENIYKLKQYDEIYFSDLEAGKGEYFFGFGQFTLDVADSQNDYYGFITKFSNEGDTIWTKRYRHPDFDDSRISHYINDIIELDNGDLVGTGLITPIGQQGEIWHFKVNSEGCFDEANCENEIQLTDIYEVPNSNHEVNDLLVYPNPSTDILYVKNINPADILKIEIFNIEGQLVFAVNKKAKVLNISKLIPGIYSINIITRNGIYTQRIVKVRT